MKVNIKEIEECANNMYLLNMQKAGINIEIT